MVNTDLEMIEAKWRLGLIRASDLHKLASNLLDEGVESESLIALFALPPDAVIWSGPTLLDAAFVELGGGELTDDTAAWHVAQDMARRVLNGTLRPSDALGQAASIHVRTGYCFDVFHRLYAMEDEFSSIGSGGSSYLGRSEADMAEDVRAEAKRIAAETRG